MFGQTFLNLSAILRISGGDAVISGVAKASASAWTGGQTLPTAQGANVLWPKHAGVVRDTGANEGNLKLATDVKGFLLEENVVDVLTAEALNYQVDNYRPALLQNETASARAALEVEFESSSPVLLAGDADSIGAAEAIGTAVRWANGQLAKNSGAHVACGTITRYTTAAQGGTFRVVISFNAV